MADTNSLKRISDCLWEIPRTFRKGMLVSGRIVADRGLLDAMDDTVVEQTANVAMLPGIVGHSFCMPDGHAGYGFPIGGVAAMDPEDGVISPGGIGFDINCGMRLLRTNLTLEEVRPHLERLVKHLARNVPAGVGSSASIRISPKEFRSVIKRGASWCVDRGMGWREDLERTEDHGCMEGADPALVSERALQRGMPQLGTLGSGNHYLEVQVVTGDGVVDRDRAEALGLSIPGQIVVMFHCGSRGFGHQVAGDYLKSFVKVMGPRYGITVTQRDLACAPFASDDGRRYFAAMQCAANMAYANRQIICDRIRKSFAEVFGRSPRELDMHQVYDVAHNVARLEEHVLDGRRRRLLVHRKGSTRALPPGHPALPDALRAVGQPVIIGGSMETGSFLLSGVAAGAAGFFSTAHGSGRTMSRSAARKRFGGRSILEAMKKRGIVIQAASLKGLAEEAGGAYKSIDDVVGVTDRAGLSRPVVKLTPIGNVKG